MARKPVFNKRTVGEEHRDFADLVGQLGMSVNEREGAVQKIPIDGVLGSDRHRERRHDDTSFYATSYVEALSAAGLMVDLGLGSTIKDVRRLEPPLPDIEVMFNDGTSVFIEQTNVIDQDARLLSLAVERANHRALELAKSNPRAAQAIGRGMFFIRLDDLTSVGVGQATDAERLAQELCLLATTLEEPIFRARPDKSAFPILNSLGARYSFKPGVMTGSIIMPPIDHGRLQQLETAFRERVCSKIKKRSGYGDLEYPVWLVLDVDHHFYVSEQTLRALANDAIREIETSGFDVVAVQHLGSTPIIFQQHAR